MIRTELLGIPLELETAPGVFSPQAVDRGTVAMLELAAFSPGDKVLDLGCGCGVVGILAAKRVGAEQVVLCDVDPVAVALARANGARNGVAGIKVVEGDGLSGLEDGGFTLILSNPPYHTDFSVAKGFIEGSYSRLVTGGRLMMVTKRLDWYRNKLNAVFGGVTVRERDGYYVFIAEKRRGPSRPAGKRKAGGLSPKLQRKRERRKGGKPANPS